MNVVCVSKQSFQQEAGAVLVETTIALTVFLTILFTGLHYGTYLNTHAVMESAARTASRSLVHFSAFEESAMPGQVITDAQYAELAAQGVRVARKYMEVAGYDPDDFQYRVSSLFVPADTASDGRGGLFESSEEIEIAISNREPQYFEPYLCTRSKFKYELPFRIGHYTSSVLDAC